MILQDGRSACSFLFFFFLFLFYPGVIRLGGVEAVDAKITAAKTGRARPPVCPGARLLYWRMWRLHVYKVVKKETGSSCRI